MPDTFAVDVTMPMTSVQILENYPPGTSPSAPAIVFDKKTQGALSGINAGQELEGQKAQQDAQLTQAKMQADQAKAQQDMQLRMALKAQKQQAEDQRTAAELQARMAMNTEDNRTALELASAEIATGERIAVSTGTGINPNP